MSSPRIFNDLVAPPEHGVSPEDKKEIDAARAKLDAGETAIDIENATLEDVHKHTDLMNANIAEYHVPVNADVGDIKVIFVDEADDSNPLGVKGVGEIGIVGVAAAVANAIYHATGKRVRDLPITIDKLLR